jgi:hypothetical protein
MVAELISVAPQKRFHFQWADRNDYQIISVKIPLQEFSHLDPNVTLPQNI